MRCTYVGMPTRGDERWGCRLHVSKPEELSRGATPDAVPVVDRPGGPPRGRGREARRTGRREGDENVPTHFQAADCYAAVARLGFRAS